MKESEGLRRKRPKKRRIWTKVLAILLLLIAAAAVACFYLGLVSVTDGSVRLVGSEQASADSWQSTYAYYEGERSRALRGDSGQLFIGVEGQEGHLDVRVVGYGGDVLFDETFTENGSWIIDAPPRVTVTVRGEAHKGSFDVHY